VRAGSVDDVVALGGVVVEAESFPWTVMKDVEGGGLCVFGTRTDRPAGLMEIVVDTSDAVRISTWWADVLGAVRKDHEHGYSYLEPVPEAPFESLVFVPVPEPKTVKNRIHIDLTTPDVQLLVDAGAGCCVRRTRRSPGASSPTPTATSSAPSSTDRPMTCTTRPAPACGTVSRCRCRAVAVERGPSDSASSSRRQRTDRSATCWPPVAGRASGADRDLARCSVGV